MTIRKLILALVMALLAQAGLFAWRYRDLIYLRQPVPAIAKGDGAAFERQATEALARERLTRHHLDTIAEAAAGFGQSKHEIEALRRRLEQDPSDVQIRLRLADALRRAGEFQQAETLYVDVLRRLGGGDR